MYAPVQDYALYRALSGRPDLGAKVLELRSDVETYLGRVSATFAHYTSHAVDHSDQIVREISALVYRDAFDPETACVELTPIEAYLLLLAAYLHDTGMVVTDQEKIAALSTAAWERFALDHSDTADLVTNDAPLNNAQEQFVRGLEQQWAIAEFFRRQHTERAAVAINSALNVDRFLAGDHAAVRSLVAICVGHGLSPQALQSDTEYPTRRDHFGQAVDVRLLTILLRLGDLLDMRNARACPLLRSSVSPLPRSSEVHWTQYNRIHDRMTSPDKIRVGALCETADEHRLLLDWCTWLANEVNGAQRLMSQEPRHRSWVPPEASVGPEGSIRIERAPGATYRVEDWKFHFDEAAVVTRLVADVHGSGPGFMRELMQNALDASRVMMYLTESQTETYANEVPAAIREKFPLSIEIETERLDDHDVVRSISISDHGTGMTPDIIKNYFLQIGRSWYGSSSFVGRFPFTPTSRFGVGFLSVFGVSDDVTVVTRWHEDPPESALSLRLAGPRGYLVIEESHRAIAGTTVRVDLREPRSLRWMLEQIEEMCTAVEFPIKIEVDGTAQVISQAAFEPTSEPLPLSDDFECRTRRIDVTGDGAFGYFELLTVARSGVEDWTLSRSSYEREILAVDPLADLPRPGVSKVAINGLASNTRGNSSRESMWRHVLDLRTLDAAARGGLDRLGQPQLPGPVLEKIASALDRHLESHGPDIDYLAGLVEKFNGLCPAWARTRPYIQTESGALASVEELLETERLLVPHRYTSSATRRRPIRDDEAAVSAWSQGRPDLPCITLSAKRLVCEGHLRLLTRGRWLTVAELETDLLVFEIATDEYWRGPSVQRPVFDDQSDIVAVKLSYREIALNADHPLVREIDRLAAGHAPAKDRLLEGLHPGNITHWREYAALLGGVASVVGSNLLAEYARLMAKGPEFSNLSLSVLRLPRD
ncbi:HD domain-containing protein [Microbacterium sp. PA5]|uniref:HD domain-containing protein n=1 Tax=Microbacterium sp. PA5 TaxID=3416654 RepID=UPI003CEB9930